MLFKGINTHSLFLLTEHRHGNRGHQEEALGLSVEQLRYTDTQVQNFIRLFFSIK